PAPESGDTSAVAEPDADDHPVVEGTLRAPWRWEQLLVESAVIGGKDRWSRRLNGLEAEYRARLARLREEEPDSPRAAALRRDLGAALVTQDERGRRERLLLRLAVGAARRRLHLSYSRVEQTEARPRVPSFYALEVARALTGRVPEPQRMEREAAAAAGARLAWPAPDDPARAIDEVEHDLAMLRGLLAGGEARGRARYLLEL